LTTPENFDPVLEALKAKGIETISAEISMIPQTQIKLEGKNAQTVVKLMEAMEEHDDVQHVYSNFEVEEDEMAGTAS